MAFVGLIAGVVYSFGGAIIDVLVSNEWMISASTPGVSSGTALAFLALIGMPVYFAVFGFIAGAIGALLCKLVEGRVGGQDDKGDGSNDRTRTFWGVNIGGSALVGALVGGMVGGLFGGGNDVVESAFGGAFFGALIGGCLVGNVLGIVGPIFVDLRKWRL